MDYNTTWNLLSTVFALFGSPPKLAGGLINKDSHFFASYLVYLLTPSIEPTYPPYTSLRSQQCQVSRAEFVLLEDLYNLRRVVEGPAPVGLSFASFQRHPCGHDNEGDHHQGRRLVPNRWETGLGQACLHVRYYYVWYDRMMRQDETRARTFLGLE